MPAVVTRAHAAGAGTIRVHQASADMNSSAVLLGFSIERERRPDWRMAFGALRDVRPITVPWNRSVCERRADYRSASAAAPWPCNQALALRTAKATSDARRPAAVLKRRPNCRTVSTHPSPMTPRRSRIGAIWSGIVPRLPARSCRPRDWRQLEFPGGDN